MNYCLQYMLGLYLLYFVYLAHLKDHNISGGFKTFTDKH